MSTSTRPHKRQRTSQNIFLDLEAVASDGAEDDDDDEFPDEFVADNQYDTTSEVHSALFQSFMSAGEDDQEDERLGWQSFVERSHKRGTRAQISHHTEYDSDPEAAYQLQEQDMLWEIGCKVGSEETVAYKILQRALHPSTSEVLASSVVATSVPGRVYAEVSTFAQATKLAQSFAELNPSQIAPVPREDMLRIINIESSRHTCQQWARVGGKQKKWHWYLGDTGFIKKIEGSYKKYLALVPRLVFDDIHGAQSRPPQALVGRGVLETRVGSDLVNSELHDRFTWKGQRFTAEGLLLVDLDDIDIVPMLETLPSSAELALFRSTSIISSREADKAARQIAQTRIKVGDRVKVMTGPYFRLIGKVMEMKENEVTVYLPSQDITEDMPKDTVRAAFAVGDQVEVLDGQHKSLIGWVVKITVDTLCVLNIKANIEINVSKADVEFHSSAHITSLQPRDKHPKWGKLGEQNPNDVYIGKRVMVIGRHELKGYKGLIKSTSPDGYALLQLDSRPQQSTKVELNDLACLSHQDALSSFLLTNQSLHATTSRLMESSLAASASSSNLGGLTPAWDPSSHTLSDLSPAWDPSSQTPLWKDAPTRPLHWLDDPGLQASRLKLQTSDPTVESPYVEFIGIENDLVKVRDKMDYKYLPFESVTALLPSSKGDLVMPRGGEMQGVRFKVIDIIGDPSQCVVRKPGTRPSKKNPDQNFVTSELVQVYPCST